MSLVVKGQSGSWGRMLNFWHSCQKGHHYTSYTLSNAEAYSCRLCFFCPPLSSYQFQRILLFFSAYKKYHFPFYTSFVSMLLSLTFLTLAFLLKIKEKEKEKRKNNNNFSFRFVFKQIFAIVPPIPNFYVSETFLNFLFLKFSFLFFN